MPSLDPRFMAAVLIAIFAMLEAMRWRHRRSAQLRPVIHTDRGTTTVLGGCCGITVLALLWPESPPLALAPIGTWAGVVICVCGLGLRSWAAHALQQRDQAGNTTLRHGPYRIILHPNYLGNFAFWCGAAMTSGNLVASLTVAVAMLAAYVVRISSGETFAGANNEMRGDKCWRLIPFIY